MKSNILTKGKLIDQWPSKQNVYECEMLRPDNTQYKTHIPKAECELIMYLKFLKDKIPPTQCEQLENLIDEYGQERYDEGEFNSSTSDEGI